MSNSNKLVEIIEEVYERYYGDVYKFLICYTGNRNDAEDLTQEVFMRVIKSFSTFNNGSNLKRKSLSHLYPNY
ncbi:sigma-70 family RNA polymerase sigma factor [Virgibacillus sp. 6R]|uniref:RNA polymerase sigma factor n=1 Tax=Metabacillus sp. 22489 TaxID=3453928 RepID=UPI0021064773